MFDSRRLMCAVSLTPTNSKASCKLSFCAKEKVLDGIAPFTVVLWAPSNVKMSWPPWRISWSLWNWICQYRMRNTWCLATVFVSLDSLQKRFLHRRLQKHVPEAWMIAMVCHKQGSSVPRNLPWVYFWELYPILCFFCLVVDGYSPLMSSPHVQYPLFVEVWIAAGGNWGEPGALWFCRSTRLRRLHRWCWKQSTSH